MNTFLAAIVGGLGLAWIYLITRVVKARADYKKLLKQGEQQREAPVQRAQADVGAPDFVKTENADPVIVLDTGILSPLYDQPGRIRAWAEIHQHRFSPHRAVVSNSYSEHAYAKFDEQNQSAKMDLRNLPTVTRGAEGRELLLQ